MAALRLAMPPLYHVLVFVSCEAVQAFVGANADGAGGSGFEA